MNNPVLKAISERRSVRSYRSDKVTREQIDVLLKAGVEAPSAKNTQPWRFTVVQNRALLDEINAETKKILNGDWDDLFYETGTVIFLSCEPAGRWTRHDCGIAVQNIALAAHSIGLGTVILGRPDAAFQGPRADYFNKKLNFPEGHNFAVAIAVGVPAETKEAHPVDAGKIAFIE